MTVTYEWQAEAYTTVSGVYDTSMGVSGYVTIDAILGPNVSEHFVQQGNKTVGTYSNLLDFSFSDGAGNIISLTNATDWDLQLWTGNSGELTDWQFDLQLFNRDGAPIDENITIWFMVSGQEALIADENFVELSRAEGSISGAYTTTVVPIPAALPLFATAIAGLGFVGWRRKSAATA